MKKTLEAQRMARKVQEFEEPMNYGGLLIKLDFSEMELKYIHESDTGLCPISDFRYRVFREKDVPMALAEKVERYLESYQKLLKARGYAESVSYTYSEEGVGLFHMTPMDDMTNETFPDSAYFILKKEPGHREEAELSIQWHRDSDMEVGLKVLEEIPIPNIETVALDLPSDLDDILDDEVFRFVLPHEGNEWKKTTESLQRLSLRLQEKPDAVLVSRRHGRNRYYRVRKAFS